MSSLLSGLLAGLLPHGPTERPNTGGVTESLTDCDVGRAALCTRRRQKSRRTERTKEEKRRRAGARVPR